MRERVFGLICTVGVYDLIISRYLALSSAREVQPFDNCLTRERFLERGRSGQAWMPTLLVMRMTDDCGATKGLTWFKQ